MSFFFEDNEEEASKYPNPGRSLSYHCLKKKKSVFWTKEYHKLQQSWTYSLFSNSAPQSTPLGVCHEASYLCCVNKTSGFSGLFSKLFSPCLSPSATHSGAQACAVAHNLASPQHLLPLSNREMTFLLQFSRATTNIFHCCCTQYSRHRFCLGVKYSSVSHIGLELAWK